MKAAPSHQFHYLLIVILLLRCIYGSGIELEYVVGFNGLFQVNQWVPVTVTVENQGDEMRGQLEIITHSGSEYYNNIYQNTYSQELYIPFNAKKVCSFTVHIESSTRPLIVRFRQGNHIIKTHSVDLRTMANPNPLIAVVDEQLSSDIVSDFSSQKITACYTPPHFLPQTRYGYDGVSMVIINLGIVGKMREKQYAALLEWVYAGGFLVLATNHNYGILSAQRIRKLLMVSINGYRELSQIKSLQKFSGEEFVPQSPFLVLHAINNDRTAVTILQEDDIPLLIGKKYGAGKMILFTFDYKQQSFNRWQGRNIFWHRVIDLKPQNKPHSLILDTDKITTAMIENVPNIFPQYRYIFLGSLLYIVLLGWLFRAMKRGKAAHWGGPIFFCLIIMFTGLGSLLLFTISTKNRQNDSSFFHIAKTANNGTAQVQQISGIYNIHEEEYVLPFDQSFQPITHLFLKGSNITVPNQYVINETDGLQKVKGKSAGWTHNFFAVQSTIELPMSSSISLGQDGIRLLIDNPTALTIFNCFLLYKEWLIPFADILPFSSPSWRIDTENQQSIHLLNTEKHDTYELIYSLLHTRIDSTYQLSHYGKKMKETLYPDILTSIISAYVKDKNRICIFGWSHDQPFDIEETQSFSFTNTVSFFSWEILIEDSI